MMLKWEQPIYDLHSRLDVNADAVSEAEARAIIQHTCAHLETSCDSGAQYLFFAVAPICSRKPHLTREMLAHAVRPLYYLGIQNAAEATAWLRSYLSREAHYATPSVAARAWIETMLREPYPLQRALADVMSHENETDRTDH